MRKVAALVLAMVLCVAGTAGAQRKKTDFWVHVAHPHRADYDDQVKQGKKFLRKNEVSRAITFFKKAIAFEPHEAEAAYWLARSYSETKMYRECADVFARLLEEHPTYHAPVNGPLLRSSIDFSAAFCFGLGGRLEQSVYHYRRLLSAGQRDVTSYWNLGDSLQALGRLEEAIREYEAATRLGGNGNRAMVRFALGVALDRDGQTARAWNEMEKGLRGDRSDWLTFSVLNKKEILFVPPEDRAFYAGFAFQVKGKRNLARAYFRKYLSKPPHSKIHEPFHVHARAHLAELGSSALRAEDIKYNGVFTKKARARIGRLVLREAAAMQACLKPQPDSWADVKLRRPAMAVALEATVSAGETGPVNASALECVKSAALFIKVPLSLVKPRDSVRFFVVAL